VHKTLKTIKTSVPTDVQVELDNLVARGELHSAATLASQTAEAATTQIAQSGELAIGAEICVCTETLLSSPVAAAASVVKAEDLISGDDHPNQDVVISGTYEGITVVFGEDNKASDFLLKVKNTDGKLFYSPLGSIVDFFTK